MDIWSILGIEKTSDVKEIKRAYAKAVKKCHPEDDPEGFMQIRKAYEEALEQAQTGRGNMEFQVFVDNSSESNLDYFEDSFKETTSKPEVSFDKVRIRRILEKNFPKVKPQLLEKVELLYNDIFKRRDVKCWQELLNNELTIDEYHYLTENAWDFFNNNCVLPYEVWKFIDSESQFLKTQGLDGQNLLCLISDCLLIALTLNLILITPTMQNIGFMPSSHFGAGIIKRL